MTTLALSTPITVAVVLSGLAVLLVLLVVHHWAAYRSRLAIERARWERPRRGPTQAAVDFWKAQAEAAARGEWLAGRRAQELADLLDESRRMLDDYRRMAVTGRDPEPHPQLAATARLPVVEARPTNVHPLRRPA